MLKKRTESDKMKCFKSDFYRNLKGFHDIMRKLAITSTHDMFQGAEFTWDKTTQSFVLSGYFYGYIVSQIPLTWATRRFGGKKVITTCMILAAVFILLVPILARASVYAVIVLRVLLGIASVRKTRALP